jgi:hypothetical protein
MMILSFELVDDPGMEHEIEVANVEAAMAEINKYSDLLVWHSLTDAEGNEVSV